MRTSNSTIYVLDEMSEIEFRVDNADLQLSAVGNEYDFTASGDIFTKLDAGSFSFVSKFNDEFF